MGGGTSSRIVLFVGCIIVVVAGYVGYIHTLAARTTTGDVSAGVVSDLSNKNQDVTKPLPIQDVKDSTELLQTIQNLQVPCGIIIATSLYKKDPSALNTAQVKPLDTILEPSRGQSTITKDAVMADRYLKILYEEAGNEKYIPAEALWLRMGSLEATLPSPSLLVVDSDKSTKYKIRLGRDFMRANKAKIDLDEMELYVSIGDNAKIMIPFLQSRASPDLGDSNKDEL